MSTSTNIVWLKNEDDEPIPHELRSHVAVFTTEDACYQFLCSLPSTLQGLTLVSTDATLISNRLIELKSIATVYSLSSSKVEPMKKNSSKTQKLFLDKQTLLNQIQEDLNRRKSRSPNFCAGFLAPFQGFYFILRNSSTWCRASVPAVIFTLILIGCLIGGTLVVNLSTDRLFAQTNSRWAHVGLWLLRIVLYIAVICLSVALAMITAQPLSSIALESLVRAQERDLNYPNRPEESFCSSVWRSIRISLISLSISILAFILVTLLDLFFPPAVFITTPVLFIITALVLAFDTIDYPLSLHVLGVRERMPWFRDHLWATLGFGLSIEIICLIPGAFLLVLPACVCGATRLVIAAERASIDQPLLLHHESI